MAAIRGARIPVMTDTGDARGLQAQDHVAAHAPQTDQAQRSSERVTVHRRSVCRQNAAPSSSAGAGFLALVVAFPVVLRGDFALAGFPFAPPAALGPVVRAA